MKINLTKEECYNVQAGLLIAAKSASSDAGVMKVLLNLRDKFEYKEPEKKEDAKRQ